ncbi:hypothetical protein [Mameliella sp.]|uniref:hypothetical protein n=1 Tax=Mameliella sp. TaxID=1924940 RepID=UPI003BACD211
MNLPKGKNARAPLKELGELMHLAIAQIRSRRRPIVHQQMYGRYAPKMVSGLKFFADMVDRSAYVYVTGQYPSHLRATYTGVLRQITRPFTKPSSLDSRTGNVILRPEVVQDMQLDKHAMVREVRRKIRLGFLIQPSRGIGTRRNYSKIFMFKLNADNLPYEQCTINIDGSVKQGW